MERKLIEKLYIWKDSPRRKPLILQGARQVGKTWLMKEFGKTAYKNVAYINLDNNPRMRQTFEKDFDTDRLIEDFSIETHEVIRPGETLIILDEIQEIPLALSSLKYFCENAGDYHIMVAGSFLGIALHKGISFPVGKVNIMTLHPLSFREFLIAMGETDLARIAEAPEDEKNQVFKNKFSEYLKKYNYIGGMPEVVSTYLETKNYDELRTVQKEILSLYEQDFGKHINSPRELERLRLVWSSIPIQLAKENKKFFFGQIKKGARASDFEVAIQLLTDCGLAHKVFRVTKPGIPLKGYADFSAYKLFMVDVGLLGAMSDLDSRTILEGERIFSEFKGAMAEQFVHQQVISNSDTSLYYYSNPKSRNEIDFLMQKENEVIPIEVKAEENLRSKSLQAFVQKFEPKQAIRYSMSGYRKQDWLTNIPLWNL